MKKLLVFVVAIAVVAWLVWQFGERLVSYFWAGEEVATSAATPWPGGLGTLDSVAARYPPLTPNDASAKLTALAKALPANEAVDSFVQREMARGELSIGEPPALPDVSAIRESLLREKIVWRREGGVVGVGDSSTSELRGSLMTVARALIATALAKGRANDPAAWEELHAVWNLARALEPYPEMMMQTASFTMARMINAVAWKMPLPPPPWFGELQQRDYVAPLLAAYQYQTAAYWEGGARFFPTKSLAASVEHDRAIAEELSGTASCDVSARMNKLGVDLSSVWRRAFRYRAEREGTANALRVREGKAIEAGSRCSDGGWSLDGTTLRFSHEIATAPPDAPMPLVIQIKTIAQLKEGGPLGGPHR